MVSCALALGKTPGQKWRIFWRQTKNLRVRLGAGQYRPQDVYRLETRHGPVSLRDNVGDVTNLPDLLHRNVYRLGRLETGGIVLDVGANIGLFAAWAAWQNPGRIIHCFEPLETNARIIPLNCPSAIVHTLGLGSVRETVRLSVDEQGAIASRIPTSWRTCEEKFEVVPLDDFVFQNGIREVAFLKIDTEGMELDILAGGRNTLQRTHRIAMETHGRERHRESLRTLREAGFHIEDEEFSSDTGLIFARRLD